MLKRNEEKLIECFIELVAMLEQSCTQETGDALLDSDHHHNMFDETDMGALEKIGATLTHMLAESHHEN